MRCFSMRSAVGMRRAGSILQYKLTKSSSRKGTRASSPKWDTFLSTLSPSQRWISWTSLSLSFLASSALGARQKQRYPIQHQSAPSPLRMTLISVCSEILLEMRYWPTEARIVVISKVQVTQMTSLIEFRPSSASQMNSVWSESICLATSLAQIISVPYFMPIEKVLNFFPFSLSSEAATLATKLESSPPDSKHPIGLSDISLYLTAFLKVSTISSQRAISSLKNSTWGCTVYFLTVMSLFQLSEGIYLPCTSVPWSSRLTYLLKAERPANRLLTPNSCSLVKQKRGRTLRGSVAAKQSTTPL